MNFFYRKNRIDNNRSQSAVNPNYFQHRVWQLLTLNEKINGIWPYQSNFVQCPLQIFHFFGLSSMLFALINGLRTVAAGDVEIILENSFWITFTSVLACIQALNLIGQRRRQKFYESVVKQYCAMSSPEEASLLRESADGSLKYVLVYLSTLLSFVVAFYSLPMIRDLYEYSVGHEDELKITLGAGLDYGVDQGKYWFFLVPIYLNFFFSGFVVGAGFEFSFILQVQHMCAVFEIVMMRLHRAMELVDEDEESYSTILSAIKIHQKCFKMVNMIEGSYSSLFFILLMANTAFTAVCLHMVTHNIRDPIEAVRFGCLFSLMTLHFYVIYKHGQMITDASLAIYDARYHCKWLDLPKKSRKLFVIMMTMQNTEPCQLTGKLFPLSMKMYGKMFKAGLSYYTVFEQ